MKKAKLEGLVLTYRALVEESQATAARRYDEALAAGEALRRLTAEVEQMREHWRPVPMTHPWQPRNPQCALCDEPRDAARHQDFGLMRVAVIPQLPDPLDADRPDHG